MLGLLCWTNAVGFESYDAENRLQRILNPSNEATTFAYDALNREQIRTFGNGMSQSHTYDPAGRESERGVWSALGVTLDRFTATYDAVGNRTGVLELDGVRVTYGYDASNQLIRDSRSGASAYDVTYTYDGVGNRTLENEGGVQTQYAYNALNALTLMSPASGAGTTLSYDGNGNPLTEVVGSVITSYSWTGENRLSSLSVGSSIETYSYFAGGKRWSKVVGSSTTRNLWDGENLLAEEDGTNSVLAQYTERPGVWGGLSSVRRSGVSQYFGSDSQESVRALVSSAGAVTDSYAYRGFGEEVSSSGSSVNPYRYVGGLGYYRESSDRLYVRARYLRSGFGRWLNPDPMGLLEGVNLFRYGRNNPLKWRDPSGLIVKSGEEVGGIEDIDDFLAGGKIVYIYTCKCGWLDGHHIRSAKGSANTMLSYYRDIFDRVLLNPYAKFRVYYQRMPPLDYTSVDFQNLENETSILQNTRTLSAYIAYRLLWEYEVTQEKSWYYPPALASAWSYEDLISDWLGAMWFLKSKNDDDRPVAKKLIMQCAPVSRQKSKALYEAMEQICQQDPGSPHCHRKIKVKTGPPTINPLPKRILFDTWPEFKELKICCDVNRALGDLARPKDIYSDTMAQQLIKETDIRGQAEYGI